MRKIVWTPHKGKQTYLFQCPAEVILYGGAKGGGKSESLIILSNRDCNKDGYKALILRRTFPELERHIIERSHRLFGGVGKYDSKNHRWTFPTPVKPGSRVSVGGKATIEFGYLERDSDLDKYQGAEYARILVDESTQHPENRIRFMMTCLRSPVPNILRQLVLGSNPVGIGFGWHKLMFIIDRKPLHIYNDARWASDGKAVDHTTCFIPSTVWDNPTLLKNDPDYPKKLQTQHGAVTRALLFGSWEETVNMALEFDFELHTCPARTIPEWATRWVGIDWGKTDQAASVWFAADHQRIYAYRDHCRPGKVIKPYAQEVVEKSRGENIEFAVLSHECFADHGMGNTQADQFREVFDKAGITVVKSDRDPEGRLMLMREVMRTTELPASMIGEDTLNDSAYWEQRFRSEGKEAAEEYMRLKARKMEGPLPLLQIFRPTPDGKYGCPILIKTLPLLVVDMVRVDRIADHQDDHSFDGATYGLKAYMGGTAKPFEETYREKLIEGMPDSSFGAEFAETAARKRYEDEEDNILDWPVEKFSKN